MKVQIFILALSSILFKADFIYAADVEKGKAKFTICAACHGGNGNTSSMPGYPKIGGQDERYLKNALHAYREGRRQGTYASIMQETAKELLDEDIDNLAAYISNLPH